MHLFFCLVIFSFLPFFGATVNGWRLVEGSHLWGHWWLHWYFSKDGWKGCVLADKSPLGCGEPSCGRENRCLLPVVGQWWTNGLVQSFNHQLNKFQNERFTPNLCSTEHRDCRWSWFKTWFKSAESFHLCLCKQWRRQRISIQQAELLLPPSKKGYLVRHNINCGFVR